MDIWIAIITAIGGIISAIVAAVLGSRHHEKNITNDAKDFILDDYEEAIEELYNTHKKLKHRRKYQERKK